MGCVCICTPLQISTLATSQMYIEKPVMVGPDMYMRKSVFVFHLCNVHHYVFSMVVYLPLQSAATVYSPHDGVVKEIIVAEDETAYLDKPLVIFEVEDDETGIMCLTLTLTLTLTLLTHINCTPHPHKF